MKYSTINRDVKPDLPIMLKVGNVEVGKICPPNQLHPVEHVFAYMT